MTVPTSAKDGGDGETEYIWTGDRWMQAPNGIKGRE
jgi:hypothetical protein